MNNNKKPITEKTLNKVTDNIKSSLKDKQDRYTKLYYDYVIKSVANNTLEDNNKNYLSRVLNQNKLDLNLNSEI